MKYTTNFIDVEELTESMYSVSFRDQTLPIIRSRKRFDRMNTLESASYAVGDFYSPTKIRLVRQEGRLVWRIKTPISE